MIMVLLTSYSVMHTIKHREIQTVIRILKNMHVPCR